MSERIDLKKQPPNTIDLFCIVKIRHETNDSLAIASRLFIEISNVIKM